LALRRHYEGKLMLYVIVNTNGALASITVKDASGYSVLDSHSSDWVKNHWRWPPGETRHYFVPFQYQIR
jgi:TonB family protein